MWSNQIWVKYYELLRLPTNTHLESPPPGQDHTISYIKVYPGISRYEVFVPTCTGIYCYIPNRHGIYLYILHQRNDGFFIVGALLSGRIMPVYTSYVQYNTFWCFKCKTIHVLSSWVETRYIHVYTSIYFHDNVHKGIYSDILIQKGLYHILLRIRPYPPCVAGEFPIHAWAFHFSSSTVHLSKHTNLLGSIAHSGGKYKFINFYILVYTTCIQVHACTTGVQMV
jgi:hypothetical protein